MPKEHERRGVPVIRNSLIKTKPRRLESKSEHKVGDKGQIFFLQRKPNEYFTYALKLFVFFYSGGQEIPQNQQGLWK